MKLSYSSLSSFQALFLIWLLSICGYLQASINNHFDYVTTVGYKALHRQFPANKLTDIYCFDMAQLSNEIRPMFWSRRFPFIGGIAESQQTLFYYQFEPLGYSKLIRIHIADPPLFDVAVTQKGLLAAITKSSLYLYQYDPAKKTVSMLDRLDVQNPIKCVSNHKDRLIILTQKGIQLYRIENNTLQLDSIISQRVSSMVNRYNPTNISISKKGHIVVLTPQKIMFFTPMGNRTQTVANTQMLDRIDVTNHSGFIMASTQHNRLYKYHHNGMLLFETSFNHLDQESLRDIVVYQPYGNMALFSKNKGAYFTMKTSLEIKEMKQTVAANYMDVQSRFVTTFPAEVAVFIKQQDGGRSKELMKRKLHAGVHVFNWKKLSKNYENGTVQLKLKALYSTENTINKEVALNEFRSI